MFDKNFFIGYNVTKKRIGRGVRRLPKISKVNEKRDILLRFIAEQINEKGYPPSVREIAKAINVRSSSTVHAYLSALEGEGLLQKDGANSRAIRLTPQGQASLGFDEMSPSSTEYLEVPVLGKITAGQPILAVQNVTEVFPLPMSFARNSDLFMLKVRGESMINAGILDGDYVIVARQQTANNGEIVVALIGDEATVKTFYRERDCIRLQPENDYLEPIMLKEVAILGKVVGVFRKF